nr:retrovirus-related Pol polyprotein from transposon TNT 1-94 [Tanacetum cinerariifolium]
MSDHEEETINEENAHPKNFISSSDILCWNIIVKGNSAKSMTTDKDEEGLDKGYDKMQKILSQMNTLKIKPKTEDVNMKFLRGLPSSWYGIALILKTKGGLEYISFDNLYNKLKFLEIDTKGYSLSPFTLSNAAFVGTTGSSQGNLSYQESENGGYGGYTTTLSASYGSSSSKGSSKFKCSVVDDEIYSFFANHEIDQQLIYEDLDQMNKEEFKEYDLKHQMAMLSIKEIQRDYSNAKTPQQNEVAERKNQTLIEAARTMLADSLLPTIFWSKAVATACYVLNRVLVTKPHHKTPYELLTGDKPSISYLKPFGYHVTILNTSDSLGKFDKKSNEGYIVGYSISSKAYRVYNLVSRKIEETMNLNFLENKPFVRGTGQAWMFDIDYLTDSLNYSRVSSTNLSAGSQGAPPSNADNLDELAELQALQMQEQAGKEEADRLGLAFPSLIPILGSLGSAGRPASAGNLTSSAGRFVSAGRPTGSADSHDGLKIFDCPKSGIFTSSSYDEEFSGLDANNLASSVDNKRDAMGIVFRNKARLVAQGHRQEEGIDYTDVFTPVARIEAIRLFLAFASFIGFMVYQSDVKSAFLYGKIVEECSSATRPDIMFAMCAAARHQVTPKTSNIVSVKRIFKYLTAYPKLHLWYPRDSLFDLEAFSNSDYAGVHGDRKSTTSG